MAIDDLLEQLVYYDRKKKYEKKKHKLEIFDTPLSLGKILLSKELIQP